MIRIALALLLIAMAVPAQESPSPAPRSDSDSDRGRRARLQRILDEETDRGKGAWEKEPEYERGTDRRPNGGKEPPPENVPPPSEPAPAPESTPSSSAGSGSAAASILKPLLWTVLILLGAVLLALAVQGILAAWGERRGRAEAKSEPAVPSKSPKAAGAGPPVRRDPDAWLADARRYAAEGRFREALRCLLFASMERLHRARVIDFERARTNREVLRRFRGEPAAKSLFGELVNAFDGTTYGGRPFGAPQWAAAEEAARQLMAGVPDESVA